MQPDIHIKTWVIGPLTLSGEYLWNQKITTQKSQNNSYAI